MPTTTTAPPRQKAERLLDRRFDADGDEHVLGPAPAGERPNGGGHVLAGRVQRVGGTEAAGDSEFAVREVEGDDRPRAAQRRTLHAIQPDPAGADHDYVGTGRHPRCVEDRARPGDDPAGQERGAVERHVLRDRHDLRGVDRDLLGERTRAHRLVDGAPVGGPDRVFLVEPEPALAQDLPALGALTAGAARADQRHDDVVAGRDLRDARPGLNHHTRGLVPVDGGQHPAPAALQVGDVAVADGAGRQPHPDLAGGGRIEMDVLDHQRHAELAANGGP
ncbi:MAG TPA: hypothetical protein VFY87_22150, partial [Geminicoccaceae bacterium]|nr:hypothetical protein [Geminicoccaceae bacterium]